MWYLTASSLYDIDLPEVLLQDCLDECYYPITVVCPFARRCINLPLSLGGAMKKEAAPSCNVT